MQWGYVRLHISKYDQILRNWSNLYLFFKNSYGINYILGAVYKYNTLSKNCSFKILHVYFIYKIEYNLQMQSVKLLTKLEYTILLWQVLQ